MIRYFSQFQKPSGLLNIASDGETYGHHYRFGDMAVAYALYLIESKALARNTIYGEGLSNTLPRRQVEILENTLMFAVLHIRNHNFIGGAAEVSEDRTYFAMRGELLEVFSKSDIPRMILSLENHYGKSFYSLWNLFRDGQRKVLYAILNTTLIDLESAFRYIYNQFYPLLHAMKEMQIPPPKVLEDPVYIINLDLKKVLSDDNLDTQRLKVLVEEMAGGKFVPDTETLNFTASIAITKIMQRLSENPDDLVLMEKIATIFRLLSPLLLNYNS